jgi:3-methyladenine DNA glycosylase AlkD
MTIDEVKTLLKANKDERGTRYFEKLGLPWSSYGIGLTRLKKLARQVGKDHELALKLWNEDNYDLVTLSTMIDEPAKVTRQQVEEQVNGLQFWMLAHSYCNNLMPKVAFQQELAEEWMNSGNDIKRRVAYLLFYNIARDNKKLEDAYFEPLIDTIKSVLQQEENFVKDAMNNALIMIGSRSKQLNEKALEAARSIGRVEVDYGDNSCQVMDAVQHLNSDRIKKKLN